MLCGGGVESEVFEEFGGRELTVEAGEVGLAVVAVISLVVLRHERLVLRRAGGDGDIVEERFPRRSKKVSRPF